MAKKKKKDKPTSKKYNMYKIEGNSISKKNKECPKCGVGTFLAQHKDRLTCGKCSYTEFASKK